jgi:glycosyltransferase involved in cell wall biosynthesis
MGRLCLALGRLTSYDPMHPPSAVGSPVEVAVCALTYRRPAGLAALLDAFGRLDEPGPSVSLRFVVVDNDEACSAEPIVASAAVSMRWPVEYVAEPRRGIAQARNRAIASANGADFVAFVDDDEIPPPGWLNHLLDVQRQTGASIVTGPVVPVFESSPPAWVTEGAFFHPRRFPTGTPIHYAATGNVLMVRDVFAQHEPAFSESFGLSGGEDTHFFLRARLAGHRIVWADDAPVQETVPVSRVEVRWLVRREYRRGNTLSLCLRELRDSPMRRVRRVGQAAYRIGQGAVLLATAVVRGKPAAVAGVQRIAFGAGLLTGLAGVRYEEYREVHGR